MATNTPQDANINIAFSVRLESNPEYFNYAKHDLLHATYYGTASKAKAKLKAAIAARVEEGLRAAEYGNRGRVICCTDGTVMVVRWSYDGWGYSITGPDRKHSCACPGRKNERMEDCCALAVEHAVQSYGGVAWECSL